MSDTTRKEARRRNQREREWQRTIKAKPVQADHPRYAEAMAFIKGIKA